MGGRICAFRGIAGFHLLLAAALLGSAGAGLASPEQRPRARDVGVAPGILAPGPWNAITDVTGVLVGHTTLVEGTDIRTGVTVVLPHGGNLYQDRVPAGVSVGNGFGKFMGTTQIDELGEIESPIVLTTTLSVPEGAQGAIEWTLGVPGNETIEGVNAVVGETNDALLNDSRRRIVAARHVIEAIGRAASGPVEEGNVGAGTGTHAFRWKGGIGTSSRRLPRSLGGYTVGVLVQTNFGGVLSIMGAPIGQELGQHMLRDELRDARDADGSIIVVIATDAPLSDRNLRRMASRAFLGLARTGAPMTTGSGDYAVAFSTADAVRRTPQRRAGVSPIEDLANDRMSPLFLAVVEATEEAIYNAMFRATTMTCNRGQTLHALPLDRVLDSLRHHRLLRQEPGAR